MGCCNECDELGLPIGPRGYPGSIVGALATIVVPAASVLTLNSSPYTLLPAPGVGKAIEVINWSIMLTYNTLTYAVNTTLQIYTDTATVVQGNNTVLLTSTTSRHLKGQLVAATGATSTQLIANKVLLLNTLTGNPTTGNSDLKIFIGYNIIDL